jgi:predicted PurR-regulated permease PerM
MSVVSPRQRAPAAGGEAPPLRLAAPSLKGVVRIVAIVGVCAAVVYLTWQIRGVVRLVVIALFVALTLLPIVDAVDASVRLSRAPIILSVFLILAAGVVVVGAVVVPSKVDEVRQLSRDAPRYATELRRNATVRSYDDRYHITARVERDARALPRRLGSATGALQAVTVKVFGAVGQLVTVLSLAFLLILHGHRYKDAVLRLCGPREARDRALAADVTHAVATYVLGNVAISGLATLATCLVLTILGVPYALSLGLVVGFFDLIPLVGATIGAVIVALSTATVAFPVATIVWVVFVVLYQHLENYVLQPLVYGRALDIDPLVTIVAVLACASLLGILGALLAIPVAAAIQILLRGWSSHRPARASAT